MTAVDVNDFSQEKKCIYKEEHYSVRDNGAVFRHTPDGKRARANDNQWTFGKENSANPYLQISGGFLYRRKKVRGWISDVHVLPSHAKVGLWTGRRKPGTRSYSGL